MPIPKKSLAAILVATLAIGATGYARQTAPSAAVQQAPAAETALEIPTTDGCDSAMGVRLVSGADGERYVTWVERHGDESRLQFSRLVEGADGDRLTLAWSAPQLIAAGDDWFVNWADFPVLAALPDGRLAATWLQSAGVEGSWSYGAKLAVSKDKGKTWSEPVQLHDNSEGPEYGFVSLVALGADAFGAVWLDSREMTGEGHGEGSMALYFRRVEFGKEGGARLGPELLLDDRTCECCSTAAVVDDGGALRIAYRDRSADEVRDMYLVTLGGSLGFDRRSTVEDGWQIQGCPVNGPSLAHHGGELAMAWFTAAGGKSAVRVARTSEGGASFGFPTQVDGGRPIGRAACAFDAKGQLFVAWLEGPAPDSKGGARWMLHQVGSDAEPRILAEVDAGRSSGFSSLIASPGGGLLFAWTRTDGDQTGVTSLRIQ